MINTLYENDSDVIYEDSLQKAMELYGDDYYFDRTYGELCLCNKNKNWSNAD